MDRYQRLAQRIIKEADDTVGNNDQNIQEPDQQAERDDQQDAEFDQDKFEDALKQGIDSTLQKLPDQLRSFADKGGDKDGELELQINEQRVDEAIGTIAGAALTGPAITKMMGQAGKWIGKKIDNKTLQTVSDKVHNFGERWHEAYEESLFKFLRKLVPKRFSDEKVRRASKALFLALVGAAGVSAGAGALEIADKGHAAGASIEGALTTIKGSEVAGGIREAVNDILQMYFT